MGRRRDGPSPRRRAPAYWVQEELELGLLFWPGTGEPAVSLDEALQAYRDVLWPSFMNHALRGELPEWFWDEDCMHVYEAVRDHDSGMTEAALCWIVKLIEGSAVERSLFDNLAKPYLDGNQEIEPLRRLAHLHGQRAAAQLVLARWEDRYGRKRSERRGSRARD